jgi:hypothetical protein
MVRWALLNYYINIKSFHSHLITPSNVPSSLYTMLWPKNARTLSSQTPSHLYFLELYYTELRCGLLRFKKLYRQ